MSVVHCRRRQAVFIRNAVMLRQHPQSIRSFERQQFVSCSHNKSHLGRKIVWEGICSTVTQGSTLTEVLLFYNLIVQGLQYFHLSLQEKDKRMENFIQVLYCFSPEVTHITPTQITLSPTSHIALCISKRISKCRGTNGMSYITAFTKLGYDPQIAIQSY